MRARGGGLPRPVNKFFLSAKGSGIYPLILILVIFITIYSLKTDIIAEVYFKKGVKHRGREDWIGAIGYYQRATAFAPYFIAPYYKLAYAYHRIGQIDKAIGTYENILFVAPYYARTQANLGSLYLTKLDYEKALFYFKQAEKLNPHDAAVLAQLALIYSAKGEKEAATDYLDRIKTPFLEHINSFSPGQRFIG